MNAVEAKREAWVLRTTATREALAALSDLARQHNADPVACTGYGAEWLRDVPPPVVDVRCWKGHRIGGVWRTDAGPLFVAWPEVATSTEVAARTWIVTSEVEGCAEEEALVTGVGGSRRRLVARLLRGSYATPGPMLASCDCGLQEIVETFTLRRTYERAVRTRAIRLKLPSAGVSLWPAEHCAR